MNSKVQYSKTLATLYALLMTGLLSACNTPVYSPVDVGDLLSGREVFGEEVVVEAASLDEILSLDAEMRAYVAEKTSDVPYSGARLNKLIQGMIDDGLLNLQYDANLSHSAIDTFHKREGNCLAFSNLFVALAREAGLNVTFQLVDIPPSFSQAGELVMLNNHINVLVSDIRGGPNFDHQHVVDFNTAEYNGNYATRKVSDNYVLALFHSNLAVEAMTEKKYRLAFEHLKKGINVESKIPGLWVNLGVFYSRHQQYDLAIQAYHKALSEHPTNKSALVNLANVHEYRGETVLAEQSRKRIRLYQQRNPYYHYFLASQAYQAEDFNLALRNLKKAIRLKKDEHQFYYLQGLSYAQMADAEAAESSFIKARDTAQRAELSETYEGKLELLRGIGQL